MSEMRAKAVLVTGGRGFIGRRLVQHLIAAQREAVISADVLPPGRPDFHGRRIDVQIDIRNVGKLRELFTQFDISAVFDLASIAAVNLSAREYSANMEMTRSMVECILRSNVGTYVFYSTQLVFRKEGTLPAGDQDYYPIEAYGELKIQSEQLSGKRCRETDGSYCGRPTCGAKGINVSAMDFYIGWREDN